MAKLVKEKDVKIKIKSVVNGEENEWKGEGEYAKSEGIHMIAYNDYTGNRVTKNGVHIDVDKLFLHRVGGVTSDMLFDVLADSIVSYSTFLVSTNFLLHTKCYEVDEDENGLRVHIEYVLHDASGQTGGELEGVQDIEILYV